MPETCTGVGELCVDPLPSWPLVPRPQQKTLPPSLTTQVVAFPAPMAMPAPASQASPTPEPSSSSCAAFATVGQLSEQVGTPSPSESTIAPWQRPAWQVSPSLQALPSLHDVPSAAL